VSGYGNAVDSLTPFDTSPTSGFWCSSNSVRTDTGVTPGSTNGFATPRIQ
jgi:hypothetical protein